MRVLDLFSGIGGFSLGLERAGMTTVAFCEIEDYPRRVLAKHWPGVPIYNDIRKLTAERLRADGITVDLICGGFPCQDISDAGPRIGIKGARSGLWFEYCRLIENVRPQYVIVENVLALRYRGLGSVLRSLNEIGYDAEWHCIPACAVGAPHRRDRIWVIAYPAGSRLHAPALGGLYQQTTGQGSRDGEPWRLPTARLARSVANAEQRPMVKRKLSDKWRPEPDVARMVDGVSGRLVAHEIKAFGNSLVPDIPEIIGRAILAAA